MWNLEQIEIISRYVRAVRDFIEYKFSALQTLQMGMEKCASLFSKDGRGEIDY